MITEMVNFFGGGVGQLSHLGCWVFARTIASEFGESIKG